MKRLTCVARLTLPFLYLLLMSCADDDIAKPLTEEDLFLSSQLANTKIAFNSGGEIYVINADGTNPINLTNNPANDIKPSWSPDGTKIAFDSDRLIIVTNLDGTNRINLTNSPSIDTRPTWSPDGTKIAFDSFIEDNWEIYVMSADGTNRINLTNNPADDFDPSWSPNGAKIVFSSSRPFINTRPSSRTAKVVEVTSIYVMNADGTLPVELYPSPGTNSSWSPFLK